MSASYITDSEGNVIEEKNIDTFKNKIEEKLKYATDDKLQELLKKENLSYMYNFEYYGRYKIREILIKYYILNKKLPY